MFITMKPPAERPVAGRSEKFSPTGPLSMIQSFFQHFSKPRLNQAEFMQVCRKILKPVSSQLQVFASDLSKRGLSTGKGYDVEFIVTGPDWDKLVETSETLKKKMQESPLLGDVNNNYLTGQPEIQIVPDRVKSSLRGVDISN